MKVPTPRKLPSGKWFVQLRIDGRSISITEDTEDLCIAKAMAYKSGIIKAKQSAPAKTLYQAVDDYLIARSTSLSPSTVRGYRAIQRLRFPTLMQRSIRELTAKNIQSAIDSEVRLCSPKTVTNAWRFLSSVIYESTGERFDPHLPAIVPNERPYLTPEQIPVFLEAIKDTPVEVPALLGLLSLRRSEIVGLKWENIDLSNKLIHISGSSVVGEDGKLVRKPTNKNKSSRRTIPMTARLAKLLETSPHTSEFVVSCHFNTIYDQVNAICKKHNLPQVGVHGLRHSFASLAYSLRIPEKTAMKIGGWADDATMRKIYTHVSKSEIADESSKILGFLDDPKTQIANENANGIYKPA